MTKLFDLIVIGKDFDLHVAEADFVAVVLEEDVAGGVVAEVRPVTILAVGDEGVPLFVAALILQHLGAVEPMLDVVTLDNDHGCLEAVGIGKVVPRTVAGGDEVVEGGLRTIALHAEFGIGMEFVVEDLELTADG